MCGIAGIISGGGISPDELSQTASAMASTMVHRGPDDGGQWTDENGFAALSHRRLSIIDISPEGHQPMVSSCGRYVISYNGEVYNFEELRAELKGKGRSFRGSSDTEVILEAVAVWGLGESVKRFTGMFAIAVWDRKEKKLSLIRDRLGIKPLYYGNVGGGFVFASELKAFRKVPGFDVALDPESAPLYFHYGYFPAPYTVYKNAKSLRPGYILEIECGNGKLSNPKIICYWSGLDAVLNGKNNLLDIGEAEAVEELEKHLSRAVRLRMVADVPLGAFLSGGIDSSIIVALMQKQSTEKIKTFTIGFHEQGYNEAEYAKKVAAHLGTEHTELYISEKDAMDVIPLLSQMYDEPFSDQSQIPTHLVSCLARKHVTVALTGDGGDELFGGYEIYSRVYDQWQKNKLLNPVFAAVSEGAISAAAPFLHAGAPIIEMAGKQSGSLRERALFRANALKLKDFDGFYRHYLARYPDLKGLMRNSRNPIPGYPVHDFSNNIEQMMYTDMVQYLPDDILVKMDRASMAVSLEARVPMIDHNVVEFAWRLPHELKVRNGKGKYILRKLLHRHVPEALVERPKMGFAVPVGRWISGPLREWADELLSPEAIENTGFFNTSVLRSKWTEHVNGKYNHEFMLWTVLMYMAWLKNE